MRHELVIIDPATPNYQQLVNDIRRHPHPGRQLDVVVLDGGTNGVEQVSAILARYHNLAALYIISHGTDGAVKLGNQWLDQQQLPAYEQDVRGWGAALRPGGDILFYGCDVAGDEAGRQFLQRIHELTGADVAANTQDTGAAKLGGDWTLDFTTSGPIRAAVPFTDATLQHWQGVLGTPGVTADQTSSASGVGVSSLTWQHTVGTGLNRVLIVSVSIDGTQSVASVTYGGAALTLIGASNPPSGPQVRSELWALTAPPVGTANIVVTLSGGSTNFVAGATDFFGVDQTTAVGPFAAASGTGGKPAVTVSSQANDVVVGVAAARARTSGTAGSGQSELWQQSTGTSPADAWGASGMEAGSASVKVSWTTTGTGAGEWSIAAVSLHSAGTSVLSASSTAVSSSGASSVYGQAVTFTATVSAVAPATGTPTGTVTFADGGTTLGTATLSGGTATFTTPALSAGSHSITVSYSGDGSFTSSTSGSLSQTVAPAPLTVTASDASKVYGDPNPSFTASYSGFVNGDSAASLGGALAFSTPATASSPVGTYPITPGGLTSSNYTITFADGTLTVVPASLSASSTAVFSSGSSSVYGNAVTFTATVSAVAPATGTPTGAVTFADGTTDLGTVTLSGGTATLTTPALSAGSHSITVSYSGDGTFAPSTSTSLSQTVAPATLTVTADDASRMYGDADPSFTASYSGFVNGDTASVVSGSPSLSTAATAGSHAGTYAITAGPGTLSAANYAFAFQGGTLTVTPAALTVTADDASRAYGDPNPAFTASYSGFVNGDTAASLGGALTFSTPATAASPVGTYAVTPGGLTSGDYAITFAGGTLTVAPATLTVTADDASRVYGQANPSFTDTITGFVNGDTASVVSGSPSLSTAATAGSHAGTYAITAGPGSLSAANYAFAFQGGTLTVTPAPLTVTADDASRAYRQSNPSFTASYSGFANGDSAASLGGALAFSTPATAASPVGTYAVTPGGLTSGDYAITFADGTLTIAPATLTVIAANVSKVTGQPNPSFTASYSGFANGDSAASLGGTLAFTTPATSGSPVGTYPVTPGGLTSSNYALTFVPGTLTIAPPPAPASPQPVSAGPPSPSPGTPEVPGPVASVPVRPLPAPPSSDGEVVQAAALAVVQSGETGPGFAPVAGAGPAPSASAGAGSAPGSPQPGGGPPVPSAGERNGVRAWLTADASSGGEPPAAWAREMTDVAFVVHRRTDAFPFGTAGSQPDLAGPPDPPSSDGKDTLAWGARELPDTEAPAAGGTGTGVPSSPLGEQADEAASTFGAGGLSREVSAVVGTAGLLASTGYVLFNTRVGTWLLSMLAAKPLWKQFDPLEVLYAWEQEEDPAENEDGETLVSLVQ